MLLMPKIKKILPVLLAIVISLFITRASGIIPVGTQPQIQEIQVACGRDVPESPIPSRTYGLPLPYITRYWGNPTCGFWSETSQSLFALDTIIWFVAIMGIFVISEHVRKTSPEKAHRKS